MKLSTRELVTVAVFGALWGLVEMSLGSVLKALHVPLSGMVLSTIGLTLALIGRQFVPRRGSTLFIGVIAAMLKLFSLGNILIGPMIGILTEAIVAEIILSAGGKPRRWLFVVSGAAGVLWVLLQPFVTNPLLFGRGIVDVWLSLVNQGSSLLGLDAGAIVPILAGMVAIHIAIGSLAGWFAWSTSRLLQTRMGRDRLMVNSAS